MVVLPGWTRRSASRRRTNASETALLQEGFQRRRRGADRPGHPELRHRRFPADSTNRHELLTIADANLYKAKRSERGGGHARPESQRANRHLRAEGSFGVLDAMVTAVDNKDRYTRRHSEDVTEYSLWIAEELGLSRRDACAMIRVGGLLHDVGKIGVPDEILRKPGRLTAEEYEIMKRHPQLGALIVGGVPGHGGRRGRRALPPRALGRPGLSRRRWRARRSRFWAGIMAVADAF